MKFEMWSRFGNEITGFKIKLWFIDKKMKLWYNIYDEKYIVIFWWNFLPLFIKDPNTLPKKFHHFYYLFQIEEKKKVELFYYKTT